MTATDMKYEKETWGGDQWKDEPDRKEWRDEATGMPCLALRNSMGAWCGYVAVAPTHPAHGLHYDGAPDAEAQRHSEIARKRLKIFSKLMDGGADFSAASEKAWEGAPDRPEPTDAGVELRDVNVHGGLTYAGACNGHICHTPAEGESDDAWWFGFDCSHAGDYTPQLKHHTDEVYRDLPYIERECASLASQLHAMTRLLTAPEAASCGDAAEQV